MSSHPSTSLAQQRVLLVLERMSEQVRADADVAVMFSDGLDAMLDEIAADDGFGTEGQRDPRGDGRDGVWSMQCVQGIDPAEPLDSEPSDEEN
jgi:hypothetical protein